jgi:hypothetical protein
MREAGKKSSRQRATSTIVVDNDRVRVTRNTWPAGAETGWHRHEHDYVIVPYSDCRVRVEEPGGVLREAGMQRDAPYFRARGVEHNVISLMDQPFSLIEIEIK